VTLEIRRATPADIDTVIRVLDEAAAWWAECGNAAWQVGRWDRQSLESLIAAGQTFLAYRGDQVLGTFNLQWADKTFWPDAADDAGYVHRLGVAREGHGRSVGRELLAFAERTARDAGKRFLRLDCACDSQMLRAYYASAGFTHRGDRVIAGATRSWCGALFEKAL
jgi:protein-tyrosine phosphatase